MLTREEKRKLGLLTLLDIVISIADILFLALLLFIIHFYTEPSRGGRISLPFVRLGDFNPLLVIIGFFLLFSVKNLAGFINYRAQCRFLFRVATRISKNKLKNYLEGSYSDYINVDSSANVREISHDPSEFSQHVLGGIQQIITQGVLILLSILAIVLFNARLFLLLFLILLPPVFAIFYHIRGKRHSVRNQAKTSSERSLQHLQEALSGFVESNIYDKNDVFLNRYITYQQRFNKYISDQLIVQGIPNRTIEIFALLGIVILMVMNSASGADHTAVITIGVFTAAAYKIIPGIVKILNITGQINTYAFTIHNLADTGKSHAETEKTHADTEKAARIRSIEFRQIHFSYGGQPILDNLDLKIGPGDFLGISGHSGKGKTTILNLLLGFLTPDKGEILINEKVSGSMERQGHWPRISYVKQQSFLIHDSIYHNITLDEDRGDANRLQDAIARAGLKELIANFPEKGDKILAEDGKNISGGQRQRIAIARALYRDADLILLDEPFNELDEASECRLLEHFSQLAQTGKLIILITHNKKSLSFCNKTVSLDEEQA